MSLKVLDFWPTELVFPIRCDSVSQKHTEFIYDECFATDITCEWLISCMYPEMFL